MKIPVFILALIVFQTFVCLAQDTTVVMKKFVYKKVKTTEMGNYFELHTYLGRKNYPG